MRLVLLLALLIGFCLVLVGCRGGSVSGGGSVPTGQALDENSMNLIPIDPGSVFLAEKTVLMSELGSALEVVGSFHTYHEWDSAFIGETVGEVKGLKVGEALEQSIYTKVEKGSQQVRVLLIRKDAGSVIVRMTCSDSVASKAMQKGLDGV